MNDFIKQLIERHADTAGNIQPRVSGRFDNDGLSKKWIENESWDTSPVESFQPRPAFIAVGEDHEEKEPTETDIEKDSTAPKRNSTARNKELMGESNESVKKQQPSLSVVADNIQPKPNQITGTKRELTTPAEKRITGLQKRYLEKIHFTESIKEENQEGDDSNNTGKEKYETFPLLRDPVRAIEEDSRPQSFARDNQAVNIQPKPEEASQRTTHPSPLSNKTIPQTIHISIDRIEIRAQYPPQAETRVIPKKEIKGIMALDEYLEKRKSR